MPRKCSACESDHLKEIDSLLINNESNRFIATRFNLTPAAVQRHKANHLPKLLVKAKDAEVVASADKLIDRVQSLLERATRLADAAEKSKNLTAALMGVREIRGVLELIGRINGELQTGGNLGVQIVNGQPSKMVAIGSAEWQRSFTAMIDEIVADAGGDDD
jgi:hypothetical protein